MSFVSNLSFAKNLVLITCGAHNVALRSSEAEPMVTVARAIGTRFVAQSPVRARHAWNG